MRRKKEDRKKLREIVADSVDTSKEIILDTVKIVMIGSREITVENYKGIIEYTENLIVLETKPHRLRIEGQRLEVKTISREMLYVMGKILKIQFLKEM